jgi:hypothetical protein
MALDALRPVRGESRGVPIRSCRIRRLPTEPNKA